MKAYIKPLGVEFAINDNTTCMPIKLGVKT
jgi:hypothetical protein